MRKVLIFIGSGESFSKENINNSAYYLKEDKIVLFDCGESVFMKLED